MSFFKVLGALDPKQVSEVGLEELSEEAHLIQGGSHMCVCLCVRESESERVRVRDSERQEDRHFWQCEDVDLHS